MIVGTGIDIVEVERIKKQLQDSGERFYSYLFTPDEIAYCIEPTNLQVQSQRFGGRFAAKEAFFKAIGTGWRDGLSWKDVEVKNDDLGKPYIVLANKALGIIEKESVTNIQVSISHGKEVAASIVLLER
jgi:holo-[acyl-carrier protein] synthase